MSYPVLFPEPILVDEIASSKPQDTTSLQGTDFSVNWYNCYCSGHDITDLGGCLWEPHVRLCRISEWGKKKDFCEKEFEDPIGILTLDTKGLNVDCISTHFSRTTKILLCCRKPYVAKKKEKKRQRTLYNFGLLTDVIERPFRTPLKNSIHFINWATQFICRMPHWFWGHWYPLQKLHYATTLLLHC